MRPPATIACAAPPPRRVDSIPMSTDQLRAACKVWLDSRWQGVYANGSGAWIVPHINNTACFVAVGTTADGRDRIHIRAPILVGVAESPELYGVVSFSNLDEPFGFTSVWIDLDAGGRPSLEFGYSLLAETATSAVLNYLVELVSKKAVQLIEQLQPAFGGHPIYEL